MSLGDSNIPILGQVKLLCMACKEEIKQSNIQGTVVCMNINCPRVGLLSMIAKDPRVEQQEGSENG